MEHNDVITWEGLRNGLVLGLLTWAVLLGGIYAAWQVLS